MKVSVINGVCKSCFDEYTEKFIAKLKQDPLWEERQELGKLLMRHIDDLTPEEKIRYDQLVIKLMSNGTETSID